MDSKQKINEANLDSVSGGAIQGQYNGVNISVNRNNDGTYGLSYGEESITVANKTELLDMMDKFSDKPFTDDQKQQFMKLVDDPSMHDLGSFLGKN